MNTSAQGHVRGIKPPPLLLMVSKTPREVIQVKKEENKIKRAANWAFIENDSFICFGMKTWHWKSHTKKSPVTVLHLITNKSCNPWRYVTKTNIATGLMENRTVFPKIHWFIIKLFKYHYMGFQSQSQCVCTHKTNHEEETNTTQVC